ICVFCHCPTLRSFDLFIVFLDRLMSPNIASHIVTYSTLFRSMPVMNGCGEESAKLSKAGAASWAKREAAYLEWRMEISSKSSTRSEEHTSELQSREKLVCRLLLAKKINEIGRAHV